MTRRGLTVAARVAALLTACLALTSCTSSDPSTGGTGTGQAAPLSTPQQPAKSRIDVDTPELRAVKRQAGIATCAPGTATNRLPALTLPCLGGGPAVALAGLKGPLVLNLFAEYCGPCKEELPRFEELATKAAGRVRVVGVDYFDTNPEGALDLAREAGVTYPLLADTTRALRVPLRERGLPITVFVRRDGSVGVVRAGAFRSYAELRAVVQQQLGVTVPS